MERDPNPFPPIDLLPRLHKVEKWVAKHLRFFDFEVHDYSSNHYHPHGAEELLSEEQTPEQLRLNPEAWW